MNFWKVNSKSDFTEIKKAIAKWEGEEKAKEIQNRGVLFRFNPNTISKQSLDSLAVPEIIKSNILKYREKGGRFYNSGSLQKIYGMNDSLFNLIERYLVFKTLPDKIDHTVKNKKTRPKYRFYFFDPNHTTGNDLEKLGFNSFQIQNLLKYREKGGEFRMPPDLLKIYGVDSVFYNEIKPWIKIDQENLPDNIPRKNIEQIKIELNSADSLALIKLNGIGPVFASRIIRYRKLLGGFCNKEQLLEVYNLKRETYDLIKNKIVVDTVKIKKLSLNFSDFNELVKHPYLKGDDVKNILRYRNKYGAFETCLELVSKNLLGKVTFNKIKPYLKLN